MSDLYCNPSCEGLGYCNQEGDCSLQWRRHATASLDKALIALLKSQQKQIAELEAENARLKVYGHARCELGNCDFDGTDCPAQEQ